VNDSDLYPEMREMPMEHTGLTEMVFCLVRYEVGNFLGALDHSSSNGFDGNWHKLSNPVVPLEEKDKLLNDLENRLEQRYLRYCDSLIPLHLLVNAVARTAICKMRLIAHHPRQYPDGGANMPEEEKERFFAISLQMIESDTMSQTMKSLKRYLWHINNFFQLDAFIYLITELQRRTSGPMVDRAWRHIQQAYENHLQLLDDQNNPLYVEIGNLTHKAWPAREAELARQFQQHPQIPHFIEVLRAQRNVPGGNAVPNPSVAIDESGYTKYGEITQQINEPSTTLHNQHNERAGIAAKSELGDQPLAMNGAEIDFIPVDWDYWHDLLETAEVTNHVQNGVEGARRKLFGLN
jgi:hypothetical protein